jgi:invasion protein IalB
LGLAGLVLAIAAPCGPARAQQSTSATYDDWVLQCQSEAAPSPRKVCQISQISHIKESNAPFSRVLVEKPATGKPVVLIAQLPVNVSTRAPVSVRLDDADPGVSAPFERCIPAGCFANFELKDEGLKKIRASDGMGKLLFKDAGGREVVVPLSFKGFRTAFDALLKE